MLEDKAEVEDGDVIICRCEEIKKQEIIDAINEGYTTVSDIRRRTRAGMGFCQGRTCSRAIQKIIVQETGISPEYVTPARVRPPVRPIAVEVFVNGNDRI